jgi:hypothetical protein
MDPPSQLSTEFLRKQRLYQWLKRVSRQVVTYIEVVVALSVLALVILLRIPWSSAILGKAGLVDSGAAIQGAVTVVVVAIFFEVRMLAARGGQATEDRYFADPMDVYPVLLERIRSITRQDEKTLDVLGMTLYTAWPSIRFWLNRAEFTDWTVRMTAVLHGERRLSMHVPGSWFRDSRANLNDILQSADSPTIVAKRIKLQPYGYDFMPVLHGYRLGNGDLFYSLLKWSADGKLSLDGYSYEFVPSEDRSPSAEAIREVFESWFQRASKTPWSG